jgi:hypothetical protein
MNASRWWLGILVILFVWPSPGSGQSTGGASEPWWMAWSPLAPLAESSRPPAPTPVFPSVLGPAPPRVGQHWTVGNPGALPFEVEEARTDFHALHSTETGRYRRPLDPGHIRRIRVSAGGWTPVEVSGGAMGAVSVERTSLGSGAPSDVADPYGMSPHLFADDSGTDLGRTLARLEGAGGWRLGPFGLGLAAAYMSWDTRTGETVFPRFQRGSRSGAVVGIAGEAGAFVVGARARWLGEVQAISVSNRSAEVKRVYLFEGFGEPVSQELGYREGYSRRVDREGGGFGLSGMMNLGGLHWVLFGEWETLTEKQSQQSVNEPPTDRWEATGPRLGAATQGSIAEGRAEFLAHVVWYRFSGEGTRAGLEQEGTLFEATEEVWHASAELRIRPTEDWTVATHVDLARHDRERTDLLVHVSSSLSTWRPALALEAAHDMGTFAVSAGAGVAWHTPRGGIPDPAYQQEAYRDWIAPEQTYEATGSLSRSALFTVSWSAPRGDHVSLELRYDHVTPRETAIQVSPAPVGERDLLNIGLRWVP